MLGSIFALNSDTIHSLHLHIYPQRIWSEEQCRRFISYQPIGTIYQRFWIQNEPFSEVLKCRLGTKVIKTSIFGEGTSLWQALKTKQQDYKKGRHSTNNAAVGLPEFCYIDKNVGFSLLWISLTIPLFVSTANEQILNGGFPQAELNSFLDRKTSTRNGPWGPSSMTLLLSHVPR